MPLAPRLGALLIFAVAMISLRLQFDASHAAMRSASVWATLWAMAGYFTILTNGLVAVLMGAVAMRLRLPAGLLMMMVLSIVMVGAIYHLLLAGLNPQVGLGWWADLGLHTAVPVLCLLWWLRFAPAPAGFGALIPALVWPMAYGVYALIRGALTGFFPYPFLNALTLGWGGVALNLCAIAVAFAIVGAVLIALRRSV